MSLDTAGMSARATILGGKVKVSWLRGPVKSWVEFGNLKTISRKAAKFAKKTIQFF
jgi:hypothetical protein